MPALSLFVCCHTARDARCGAAGPPLAAELQRLVRARGLTQHVRVFQTSHIGGEPGAALQLQGAPTAPAAQQHLMAG